jgi:hypothetical protein
MIITNVTRDFRAWLETCRATLTGQKLLESLIKTQTKLLASPSSRKTCDSAHNQLLLKVSMHVKLFGPCQLRADNKL